MPEKQELNAYHKLLKAVADLPKESIEHAKKDVTRKGYDTTGYQYQYLVNVFNDVLGIDGWNYDYKILKEVQGQWKSGGGYWEITVEIAITVDKTTKKLVGGHKAEAHADALKGAITNGFKKTAAMFGVGKAAYEGTLDEEFRKGVTEEAQSYQHSAPTPYTGHGSGAATSPRMAQAASNDVKACITCGAQANLKSGDSKTTGKPWSGWFCSSDKKHVEWRKLEVVLPTIEEEEIPMDSIPF